MTVFRVGKHEIRVWRQCGRWGVAVDGAVNRRWFMSEAQASGAGLLRALRLDGSAPSGYRSGSPRRRALARPAA